MITPTEHLQLIKAKCTNMLRLAEIFHGNRRRRMAGDDCGD
jgi:hypothetical protein